MKIKLFFNSLNLEFSVDQSKTVGRISSPFESVRRKQ